MNTTTRHLLSLAATLALTLSGCSDDSGGSAADAGSDAGVDITADSSADSLADGPPDVRDEPAPDTSGATGTIAGNIFNNTGTTSRTLTIALVESLPPTDPTVIIVETAPAAQQPYRFEDVPVGPFYIYAMLDVDDANDLGDPGPGDLVGQSMDPVGIFSDGEVLENINVEIF